MVISFTHSILGNVGTISSDSRATLIFNVPRTLRMQTGGSIISAGNLTLSASSSLSLKKGSYTYSLPDKSGTIALTTDIRQRYLLTFYWKSKKIQTSPDITANMYVTHLASGLSAGLNTFEGAELSQAVTDILVGDYFAGWSGNSKLVANGYSIYNNNITICNYVTYETSWKTLVASLAQGVSTDVKVALSDITTFDRLAIFVMPIF